jgi:hypothetical protein
MGDVTDVLYLLTTVVAFALLALLVGLLSRLDDRPHDE